MSIRDMLILYWEDVRLGGSNCDINRDTQELRIFLVFPPNSGVQTNFYSTALINSKFIKHIGHSIMNGSAQWSL